MVFINFLVFFFVNQRICSWWKSVNKLFCWQSAANKITNYVSKIVTYSFVKYCSLAISSSFCVSANVKFYELAITAWQASEREFLAQHSRASFKLSRLIKHLKTTFFLKAKGSRNFLNECQTFFSNFSLLHNYG